MRLLYTVSSGWDGADSVWVRQRNYNVALEATNLKVYDISAAIIEAHKDFVVSGTGVARPNAQGRWRFEGLSGVGRRRKWGREI